MQYSESQFYNEMVNSPDQKYSFYFTKPKCIYVIRVPKFDFLTINSDYKVSSAIFLIPLVYIDGKNLVFYNFINVLNWGYQWPVMVLVIDYRFTITFEAVMQFEIRLPKGLFNILWFRYL